MLDLSVNYLKNLSRKNFDEYHMKIISKDLHNYISKNFYRKYKFKWGSLKYKVLFIILLLIGFLTAVICSSDLFSFLVFSIIYFPYLFLVIYHLRNSYFLDKKFTNAKYEYAKVQLEHMEDGYSIITLDGNYFVSDYIIGSGNNAILLRFNVDNWYEYIICLYKGENYE